MQRLLAQHIAIFKSFDTEITESILLSTLFIHIETIECYIVHSFTLPNKME